MDDDTELLERRSRRIAQEMGVSFSPQVTFPADLSPRLHASPAKHVTPVSSIGSPGSPLRALNFDEYIDRTGQISSINQPAPLAGFVDPQIAQMSELHADQIRRAVDKFGEQLRRIDALTTELARLRAHGFASKAFGSDQSRDYDPEDLRADNSRLQRQVSELEQELHDLRHTTDINENINVMKLLERQLADQENETHKLQRELSLASSQSEKQQDELQALREKCDNQEHRLLHSDLKLQSTQQELFQLRASRADSGSDRNKILRQDKEILLKDKEISKLKLALDQYMTKLDNSELLRRATQRLLRKYYDLYHDLAAQVETVQTAKDERVSRIEAELAGAMAKVRDWKTKYELAILEKKEQQSQVDELSSHLREGKQQFSRDREALAHKEVLLDAIRQELADLKRRSQDISHANRELDEANGGLHDTNKLSEELEHAKQQVTELSSLIAKTLDLQSQITESKEKIDSISTELASTTKELERVRSQLSDTNHVLEIAQEKTRTAELLYQKAIDERDQKRAQIAALESDLEARSHVLSQLQDTLKQRDQEITNMRECISHLEQSDWKAESDRDSALAQSREIGTKLKVERESFEASAQMQRDTVENLRLQLEAHRETTNALELQLKAHQETTCELEQELEKSKRELYELQEFKRAVINNHADQRESDHTQGEHECGNGLNHLQSTIVGDNVPHDFISLHPETRDCKAEIQHCDLPIMNIPLRGNTGLAPVVHGPSPKPTDVAACQANENKNENSVPTSATKDTHQARIALDVYVRSEPALVSASVRPILEPRGVALTSCTPAASITRGNNAEYGLLW